jgi:propionate catabolism operon transcriptional regulator
MAEAREQVLALVEAGIKVVVGSSLVVALAEEHGIKGVMVHGIASVERALNEAITLAERAIRQEDRFDHLNMAFARLHEAVLTVDSQQRIMAINLPMSRILGLENANPIGQRLSDLPGEVSLAGVLAGQDDDVDVVVHLSRGTFLMSRSAIQDRGGLTGAMLTLRDASAIHRADTTIRSQRRARSLTTRYSFDLITGRSPALERARAIAQRCARTSSTVLIDGETGTGKELFAQAIHNASARQRGPFVALNCAAFPESLLESELFGYDEGSFTGSRKGGKPGLFEAAHTGTLFLDEIGDMPLSLQTRLLRVLQEREVLRLGSNTPISIDVRVIAATHRSLPLRIAENQFRADLYYRLNILRMTLPPLRDRPEDLPALSRQLFETKLRALGSALPAEPALLPLLPMLMQYRWPGNIRELDNLMERLAVFLLGTRDLDAIDYEGFLGETPELAELPAGEADDGGQLDDERIIAAIRATGGNRQAAAQALGISRTTLWRRLKDIDAG